MLENRWIFSLFLRLIKNDNEKDGHFTTSLSGISSEVDCNGFCRFCSASCLLSLPPGFVPLFSDYDGQIRMNQSIHVCHNGWNHCIIIIILGSGNIPEVCVAQRQRAWLPGCYWHCCCYHRRRRRQACDLAMATFVAAEMLTLDDSRPDHSSSVFQGSYPVKNAHRFAAPSLCMSHIVRYLPCTWVSLSFEVRNTIAPQIWDHVTMRGDYYTMHSMLQTCKLLF